MMRKHLAAVLSALTLLATPVFSEEPVLKLAEPWCNVWAGRAAVYTALVNLPEATDARVLWRWAAGNATLQRGEQMLGAGDRTPVSVRIPLELPPVKAGVVLALRLELTLQAMGQVVTNLERQLWAFPEDPFAGREERFKQLNLHLFDPEGRTRARLEEHQLPFADVRDPDHFDAVNGLLLVGEGVSFDEYRGLLSALVAVASRGVPVLCLAPREGTLALPGVSAEVSKPGALRLEGTEVLRQLDKRLDPAGWSPDGRSVASSLLFQAGREDVQGRIVEGAGGWPWLELSYGGPARLVMCGFALEEHWEASPTPRWLLAALLEWLDPLKPEQAKEKDES